MIFPPHCGDCLGPPDIQGYMEYKRKCQIAHKRGNCSPFVGTELVLGVSRQNIQKQIKCWMDNQHVAMWQVLLVLKRHAQKLILDPSLTAKIRLLFFNSTQTRVVTGLLTWHNTLRKHLCTMRLIIIPLCRGCGAEEENSAHAKPQLHSDTHTWFPFSWTWNFSKGIGLPWLGHQITGHKGPVQNVYVYRDQKGSNPFTILFYSILHLLCD
jgi:hypothetical protein